MKKASAKLRRKIKMKFCREISRMDAKFAAYSNKFASKRHKK